MMRMSKAAISIGLCLMLGSFALACARLNPNAEGQLASALTAKTDAFKACYEDVLTRDRTAMGKMNLVLEINEDPGKVTSSKVAKSDINDPQMKKCVSEAAQDITLPEPPGVLVEGRYELVFAFE